MVVGKDDGAGVIDGEMVGVGDGAKVSLMVGFGEGNRDGTNEGTNVGAGVGEPTSAQQRALYKLVAFSVTQFGAVPKVLEPGATQ